MQRFFPVTSTLQPPLATNPVQPSPAAVTNIHEVSNHPIELAKTSAMISRTINTINTINTIYLPFTFQSAVTFSYTHILIVAEICIVFCGTGAHF
jgi:hypothetical protein